MNTRKTKIMASRPMTSRQMEGEKVVVTAFLFLGSKITADDDCGHEIRRHLLLAGKLDSVEKQRHYSANKSPYHQGSGLPSGHVWLFRAGP